MNLEEKQKTESKEKDKALSLVLCQIERNFGRGSIMRLGDASRMKVETISTGALTLDLALGGGYLSRLSLAVTIPIPLFLLVFVN